MNAAPHGSDSGVGTWFVDGDVEPMGVPDRWL